ncbi:hypothetical protein BDW22DRAFT_1350305 [Trametopsis cervina]|nr:hypothetical protein BDW22DRAFT_1350305 [Trametopsis cervina]
MNILRRIHCRIAALACMGGTLLTSIRGNELSKDTYVISAILARQRSGNLGRLRSVQSQISAIWQGKIEGVNTSASIL